MIATITETVSSSVGLVRVLPNRRRVLGYDLYRDRSLKTNVGTAAPAALKWFLSCCCRSCVKILLYSSHAWHAGPVI